VATWVHTSGWRLGDGAAWAPEAAELLEAGRRDAVARLLARAEQEGVSAVVVAGDLFADNQVDGEVVEAARELLAAAPSVSVFVVPGACDPLEAPSALRRLGAGEGRLRHVRVVDQVGVSLCGDVRLAAVPLFRRRPVGDPSAGFQETAPDAGHLLVAHGRAGEAPVRADVLHRLDVERLRSLGWSYLGFGGCASPHVVAEDARYAGELEVCGPESAGAGQAWLVQIEGGEVEVSPWQVGRRRWCDERVALTGDDVGDDLSAMFARVAEGEPSRLLCRLTLTGGISVAARREVDEALRTLRAMCEVLHVEDRTELRASEEELGQLEGGVADAAALLLEVGDATARHAVAQLVAWSGGEA
jgi:DNA repair exonuclease SbcCD nuclease subunit